MLSAAMCSVVYRSNSVNAASPFCIGNSPINHQVVAYIPKVGLRLTITQA